MKYTHDTLQFPSRVSHKLGVTFDAPRLSSNGGLALLSLMDAALGLTRDLADICCEWRQQNKIRHSLHELIASRIYAIALAYEDCNDMNELRHDEAFRSAICSLSAKYSLPSQPLLSLFERSQDEQTIERMMWKLADHLINTLPTRNRIYYVDVDAFHDPTYGHQQASLFNGYYGCECYLPYGICVSTEFGQQCLVYTKLRGGTAGATEGLEDALNNLVTRLRTHNPKARIILRGDAAYGCDAVLRMCHALKIDYLLAMSTNTTLEKLFEELHACVVLQQRLMAQGQLDVERYQERLFAGRMYCAGSWEQPERVVCRSYYDEQRRRIDARYVICSMDMDPQAAYETYCGRCESENRWKEMKLYIKSGRTSCTRFLANRFRLLLHHAAYALIQVLRQHLRGTQLAKASVETLRAKLLKTAVLVRRTQRRVTWRLPMHNPYEWAWRRLYARLA